MLYTSPIIPFSNINFKAKHTSETDLLGFNNALAIETAHTASNQDLNTSSPLINSLTSKLTLSSTSLNSPPAKTPTAGHKQAPLQNSPTTSLPPMPQPHANTLKQSQATSYKIVSHYCLFNINQKRKKKKEKKIKKCESV